MYKCTEYTQMMGSFLDFLDNADDNDRQKDSCECRMERKEQYERDKMGNCENRIYC